MKKFKVLSLILILIILITSLVACGPTDKMFAAYNDDSIIAGNSDTFLFKNSFETHKNDLYSVRADSFTGVKTLAKVTITENPEIVLNLSISEGEFKIVFVSYDNDSETNIYMLTDQNCQTSLKMAIPAGKYKVKIVGIEAKFELKSFDFSFAADSTFLAINSI